MYVIVLGLNIEERLQRQCTLILKCAIDFSLYGKGKAIPVTGHGGP
jgi:hypothetical protein